MTSAEVDIEGERGPGSANVAEVLASGSVRSVFQPIVDLDSGAVAAYEALARGPVGPLASPDALFGAARRSGLLSELDEACRAAAFQGASDLGLLAPLTVFVNVEPEVLDGAPLSDLLEIAEGAPGNLRIVMEITERALAARPAELLRTVERVRELGWGVALDDVGAEPASLAFMSLLCPDVVKLDMKIVQGQPSPEIAEVMNAVNAYAERSGALVLAEGIETDQHLATARALGATLGQGWLFGRPELTPVPPTEVRTLRLPSATDPDGAASPLSPFDALPAGTVLKRGPKRLLVELSKQIEREAMRLGETCVVAATFQYDRHFTASTALRYRDLVDRTGFVCALGDGLSTEPIPGLRGASLRPGDPIIGEWDVVVLSPHFSTALLARDLGDNGPEMDRTFEYALTYRRATVTAAAHQLLLRVAPRAEVPAAVVSSVKTTRAPLAAEDASARIAAAVRTLDLPLDPSSGALVRRALAASTNGVTISDMTKPDQPIVFTNASFDRLAGFPTEELVGRNCRLLQGRDTDQVAVSRMRAAIAAGRESRELLLNYRGPDRQPWWNEVHVSPVKDTSGRVVQYIGIQNDVTARVEAERELSRERDRGRVYLARIEQLAYTDSLTGLMNRGRFEDRFEAALLSARMEERAVALLFMGLDGFKSVNESLGHTAGDALLQVTAQRLQSRLRATDLLSRLGGDEFLVGLTGLDPRHAAQEAHEVARQLTASVSEPLHLPVGEVRVTASIGISTSTEGIGTAGDFGSLFHLADLRMNALKHGG